MPQLLKKVKGGPVKDQGQKGQQIGKDLYIRKAAAGVVVRGQQEEQEQTAQAYGHEGKNQPAPLQGVVNLLKDGAKDPDMKRQKGPVEEKAQQGAVDGKIEAGHAAHGGAQVGEEQAGGGHKEEPGVPHRTEGPADGQKDEPVQSDPDDDGQGPHEGRQAKPERGRARQEKEHHPGLEGDTPAVVEGVHIGHRHGADERGGHKIQRRRQGRSPDR